MQKQFIVTGMTCEHCENRIAREVGDVPGVVGATADSVAGTLLVTARGSIDDGAIAEAVEEAGYVLDND